MADNSNHDNAMISEDLRLRKLETTFISVTCYAVIRSHNMSD
jgi:hypothetical protein